MCVYVPRLSKALTVVRTVRIGISSRHKRKANSSKLDEMDIGVQRLVLIQPCEEDADQ